MRQKILCIDFDGVIHSYISGWKGVDIIPDPPVTGALDWLTELCAHADWDPQIYSSRSQDPKGILAMRQWLKDRDFKYWDVIKMPTQKPPAFLTIDDRAITFRGTFPSTLEMMCFRPWTGGYINELFNQLDEADAKATETVKQIWEGRTWEDSAITFEQSFEPEGYRVSVEDNEGIIVSTFVHLYEWSGYCTPLINDKDAAGLVKYLVELNKTEARDGYIVRDA